MKTHLLFLLVFAPLIAAGQQNCKVLLPALDSVYVGKCKNGLAHGSGEAWGRFHYTGKFADGFPQGSGIAEYRDGTVFTGYWEKGLRQGKGTLRIKQNGVFTEKTYLWAGDSIQKEILPPSYKVISQRNVSRFRIFRQGDGNVVWFYPNSTGGIATNDMDFILTGSSGNERNYNPKFAYQEVVFPFKGSIKYQAWNKLRTAQMEIFFEFVISEPGNWIVEIQN
ncbi:MAG: hypothetical protein WC699_05775 [Bacteroidales bacterium]|jgi:hypothetical protein